VREGKARRKSPKKTAIDGKRRVFVFTYLKVRCLSVPSGLGKIERNNKEHKREVYKKGEEYGEK